MILNVTFIYSHGISNTPLSPLVSPELLDNYNCHVDGTYIERALGFQYEHPLITIELIVDSIKQAVDAGIFPNILIDGRLLVLP